MGEVECFDDLTLVQLVGGIPPERAEGIEAHLAACASCRRALAVLVQGRTMTTTPTAGDDTRWLAPGAQVGRYEVGECIGAGGMGVVYGARDPSLGRQVALKVMRGAGKPAHARMSREAQAMARLSHPNVVTVHDVIANEAEIVIAMELVEGGTLSDWLGRGRSWLDIVDVFLQAGRGLAAAHAAGLVHRDFKPSNVFVRDDGRVQVGDFGLARLVGAPAIDDDARGSDSPLDAAITQAGAVLGTPRYMAPEQRTGGVDARSDQFSFCVALEEALAAARPAAFEPVLARGRASDPTERFASMTELVAALEDARARSVPVPRRRRRVLVLAVAAGGIALAATALAALAMRGSEHSHQVAATIAITPLPVAAHVTGASMPDASSVAATLAQTLARVQGAQLSGVTANPGDPIVRSSDFVLGGRVDERDGTLVAHIELTRIATGERTQLEVAAPAPTLAALIIEIAKRVGAAIAPGSTLPATRDPVLAKQLHQTAMQLLRDSKFNPAQIVLEQAVTADPEDFASWRDLVFVRSWLEASPATIRETARQARSLAPPSQRQLMDGVALYCDARFDDARVALEAAERVAGDDPVIRRAVLYYRGEVEWHDGHHTDGYHRFEQVLQLDREFGPATIHMSQYALARRDVASARFIVGITGGRDALAQIEFAAGHYDSLVASDLPGIAIQAQLVLGRDVPDAQIAASFGSDVDLAAVRIARALVAGDRPRAQQAFAELWRSRLGGRQLPSWSFYAAEALGEVLVAGGLADEASQLVALLAGASQTRPARGYHRLAYLTAALHDDHHPLPPPSSFRERRLAAATTAELAGDRATAAAILGELVADPTATWDYPERAALLRNLRALHRDAAITALCDDTRRPPIYRSAFIVLRGACARR